MESLRSFEDLEVWKTGRELRKDISVLVKTFPHQKKYRLVDQMIRCARSVTNNVAEGFGRYHYQENIQYCRQSRGSLFELKDHLIVALDEAYIDRENFGSYNIKIDTVLALLNGYINHLKQKKKPTTTDNKESTTDNKRQITDNKEPVTDNNNHSLQSFI